MIETDVILAFIGGAIFTALIAAIMKARGEDDE